MYFTQPTESLHYSGKEVAGIKNGDNLNTVIEKLVGEIDRLNGVIASTSTASKPTDVSTDSLKASNSFGTNALYTDSSYSAKLVVTPKSNSVEVGYDLNAVGAGDRIYSRVVIDGNRNGSNTVLVDSDKMSNGFVLSPDNFPATMTVEVRRKDVQSGETKVYTGSIPISSTTKSGDYPVFSKALNNSNLETQTQVNDFLYQQIVSLQKTVSNSISVDGGSKSVSSAVSELKAEIEDIKRQDVASSKIVYSNGDGNVTKTLQEAINDITSSVNALASNSTTTR